MEGLQLRNLLDMDDLGVYTPIFGNIHMDNGIK